MWPEAFCALEIYLFAVAGPSIRGRQILNSSDAALRPSRNSQEGLEYRNGNAKIPRQNKTLFFPANTTITTHGESALNRFR